MVVRRTLSESQSPGAKDVYDKVCFLGPLWKCFIDELLKFEDATSSYQQQQRVS